MDLASVDHGNLALSKLTAIWSNRIELQVFHTNRQTFSQPKLFESFLPVEEKVFSLTQVWKNNQNQIGKQEHWNLDCNGGKQWLGDNPLKVLPMVFARFSFVLHLRFMFDVDIESFKGVRTHMWQ